jgi:hypothetical protein
MRYPWMSLLLALPGIQRLSVRGKRPNYGRMDGARIVKKLLPLIILLSGVAHAQVDTVTLTGQAVVVPATINPMFTVGTEPFTVSFTIDTQSGTQSFQFCGSFVCGFSARNLTVTNLQGEIGGVPQNFGSGAFGGGGSGFPGVDFGGFDKGTFLWDFDEPTRGVQPNLDSILRNAPPSEESALNTYVLDITKVSVTTASVPEPGTLSLLTMAFMGLFASRVRRRARIGR